METRMFWYLLVSSDIEAESEDDASEEHVQVNENERNQNSEPRVYRWRRINPIASIERFLRPT